MPELSYHVTQKKACIHNRGHQTTLNKYIKLTVKSAAAYAKR